MKTTTQTNRKRANGGAAKKLFIILFSLGLAYGASAQRGGGHISGGGFHGGGGGYHGGYYGRSYVGVGLGYGLGFGYGYGLGWGYPGWYGPWYAPYPPYYYGYGRMPSQLTGQIDDIKNDYKAQIKDVRHDKTLPRKERKERVNQLEQQRDAAVIQARKDYYYNSRRNSNNGQPPRYNGNDQQPGNSQQPGNAQPQNNNKLQPGPTNGSSSNDADHPEYSDKNATNGNQQ